MWEATDKFSFCVLPRMKKKWDRPLLAVRPLKKYYFWGFKNFYFQCCVFSLRFRVRALNKIGSSEPANLDDPVLAKNPWGNLFAYFVLSCPANPLNLFKKKGPPSQPFKTTLKEQ